MLVSTQRIMAQTRKLTAELELESVKDELKKVKSELEKERRKAVKKGDEPGKDEPKKVESTKDESKTLYQSMNPRRSTMSVISPCSIDATELTPSPPDSQVSFRRLISR